MDSLSTTLLLSTALCCFSGVFMGACRQLLAVNNPHVLAQSWHTPVFLYSPVLSSHKILSPLIIRTRAPCPSSSGTNSGSWENTAFDWSLHCLCESVWLGLRVCLHKSHLLIQTGRASKQKIQVVTCAWIYLESDLCPNSAVPRKECVQVTKAL